MMLSNLRSRAMRTARRAMARLNRRQRVTRLRPVSGDFTLQNLEQRVLLSAGISLTPTGIVPTVENGRTIIVVNAGDTVQFTAAVSTLDGGEELNAFELDFSYSHGDLVLNNWATSGAWTGSNGTLAGFIDDATLNSEAGTPDMKVAGSLGDPGLTSTTNLGTFDVTVPNQAGEWLLSANQPGAVNFNTFTPSGTFLADITFQDFGFLGILPSGGSLVSIADFGDVILRVNPNSNPTISAGDATIEEGDVPATVEGELGGIIRDFRGEGTTPATIAEHTDFEDAAALDYRIQNPRVPVTGAVEATLGVDDKPVFVGGQTYSTQASFDQWFNDAPGVNLTDNNYDIALTQDGEKFVYLGTAGGKFYPIDGQLNGNTVGADIFGAAVPPDHNWHFTYEAHSTFTYRTGQYLTTIADDDLWVFINDQLVIDRGGVNIDITNTVNLDTLGLTDGQTYHIDLFYAERHTVDAIFQIETNIPIGVSDANLSSFAAVPVTLSEASPITVLVNYATADGTGVAGTDYVARSGTLVFDPGETTKVIMVPIIGDTDAEADKTFTVNLSTPVNATILDAQGDATITNDDAAATPGSIAGQVWLDGSPNSVLDAGERGLIDITVELLDGSDAVVDTTTTDASGNYTFTGVTPGTYSVRFTRPTGFSLVTANVGGDDTIDSDANPATGVVAGVVVGDGAAVTDVDAGLVNDGLEIIFDFAYDTGNFFNSLARRDLLRTAADNILSRLTDTLDAIIPSGGNSWTATFSDPGQNQQVQLPGLIVGEDQLLVFAGGQALGGPLGRGGPGGFSGSGTQGFLDTLGSRGEAGALDNPETDFGPWGGSITFEPTSNWFFGADAGAQAGDEDNFLSVAMHELMHLLGFGTADSFDRFVSGLEFTGPNAVAQYDGVGNVPMANDAHWDQAVTDGGNTALMVPALTQGTFNNVTDLEFGALADIGWEVTGLAALPTVSITATDPAAAEDGPDTGTFQVTRTGDTTGDLTVNLTIAGTATNGTDYTNIPATVVIPDGQSSATITVTPSTDAEVEGDETAIITLAPGAAYTVDGVNNSDTVTIADAVVLPTVSITATDNAAAEDGPDTGTFQVTRSGDTTGDLTVNLTITGTATNGTDYTTIPATVVIPDGSASVTITVTPSADAAVEGDETVIVTLAADAAYDIDGANNSDTVTIADAVALPTVSITATDDAAAEDGPDTGAYRVSRTGVTTGDLTVQLAITGTATNGTDYTNIAGSVVIPAGASFADITLTPGDDGLIEGPETATVTLVASAAYAVDGGNDSATVTITDAVVLPTVSIAAIDDEAGEDGPNAGTFRITRINNTTGNLTILLTIAGTATNGTDYTNIPATVVLPDGTASVDITVTPTPDATVESAETVIITVAPDAAYTVDAVNNTDTVTIADAVVIIDENFSDGFNSPNALNSYTTEGDVTIVNLGGGDSAVGLAEGSDAAFSRQFELETNVQSMTFDFRFTNPGDGDSMQVLVNGVVMRQVVGTDVGVTDFQAVDPIDLTGFAGQTVTIEVRLASTGDTNAVLQVDNLVIQTEDREQIVATNGRIQYTDSNGRLVTVTITGGGDGFVWIPLGGGDAMELVLQDTTAATLVTVAVEGNNRTTIGHVTVEGADNTLGRFIAPLVDLVSSFTTEGYVRQITLGNVLTGATNINVGGTADDPAGVYTFRSVHDLAFTSGAAIARFFATEWQDDGGVTDLLIAPSMVLLQIGGEFDADLTLTTAPAAGRTLGTALIGRITGGDWSIDGDAGVVRGLQGATFSAASFNATGHVALLYAGAGGLAGNVQAGSFGSIVTLGDITGAILATASNPANPNVPMAIASLSAGGMISNSITAPGDAIIGRIVAGRFGNDSSITAGGVNAIVSRGRFGADVALNPTGALANSNRAVLGSLVVTSTIGDDAVAFGRSTIQVGGFVRSIVADQINRALILVGADDFDTPAFGTASAQRGIGALTIRNRPAGGFLNSMIAAYRIGKAVLQNVTINNAGVPFGIKTNSLGLIHFRYQDPDVVGGPSRVAVARGERNTTTDAPVTLFPNNRIPDLRDFSVVLIPVEEI